MALQKKLWNGKMKRSNREQFVEYDKRNIKTDFLDIICGVPEGSVLGSFAFYYFCISN